MVGRGAALGNQAAQVDHSAHAGGHGGGGEALGPPPLAVRERSVGRRLHRMDQVVGDLGSVQGGLQARSGGDVAGEDRDIDPHP